MTSSRKQVSGQYPGIQVEATAQAAAKASERVACLGSDAGLDDRACFQLRVVMAEVLNNIIEHAIADAANAPIRIHCEVAGGCFRVTTLDRGRPLPSLPRQELPAADSENGRGWPIITAWTDGVRYRSSDGENTLTLTKQLP